MGGQTAFFLPFCRPADPGSSAANDREFMVVKERAGEVMGNNVKLPLQSKERLSQLAALFPDGGSQGLEYATARDGFRKLVLVSLHKMDSRSSWRLEGT